MMAFLQWGCHTKEFYRAQLVDFGLSMRKSVYKGVVFLLPKAVMEFAEAVGIEYFVTRTRCSSLFAFMADIWPLEIDLICPDCIGLKSYGYNSASNAKCHLHIAVSIVYPFASYACWHQSKEHLDEIGPLDDRAKGCLIQKTEACASVDVARAATLPNLTRV